MPDRRRTGTRDSLIRSATGMFRRRGVTASSIADICSRAGVTKGVFVHHFPGGRTELAGDVVRRNGIDVALAINRISSQNDGQFVRLLFDSYFEAMRTKGSEFGCPVAAAIVDFDTGDHHLRDEIASVVEEWRRAITNRLTPADPNLALVILAALEGGILLARASRDPSTLRLIGKSLTTLLDTAPAAG